MTAAQQPDEQTELNGHDDAALQLALVVLDRELSIETRRDAATELEALLPRAGESLRAVLFARPLHEEHDLAGATTLATRPGVRALLGELSAAQPHARAVFDAWERLPDRLFETPHHRRECRATLVRGGWFLRLVRARQGAAQAINTALLELLAKPELPGVRNRRELVTAWVMPLRVASVTPTQPASHFFADDANDDDRREREHESVNRAAAFARMEREKHAIEEALSQGKTRKAEELAAALVDRQLIAADGARYAVRTLCDLAKKAKDRGHVGPQLRWAERAVQVAPDDGWAWGQYADALKRSGRGREAREAAAKARMFTGEDVVAMNTEAEALRASGDLSGALRVYEAAIGAFPINAIARNGRAEVLKAMGRLSEALAAYDEVIRDHQNDVVTRNARADVLKTMGRFPEALEAYETTLRELPHDAFAGTGRAETLRAMGRLSEALAAYDALLPRHPHNIYVRNGRAALLKAMERFPEALAAWEGAIRDRDDNLVARRGRAATLASMGRLSDALDALCDVLRESPNDVAGKNGRAAMLKAMGRLPEARIAYETTVREHPHDPVARCGLAHFLSQIHARDAALAIVEEGAIPEHDVHGLHIRGLIYMRLGRLDDARSTFERGLARPEVANHREHFLTALAALALRHRQHREGLEHLATIAPHAAQSSARLLQLHAWGLAGDAAECAKLESVIPTDLPPAALDVRNELFTRYIRHEVPQHDDAWLFERECDMLGDLALAG